MRLFHSTALVSSAFGAVGHGLGPEMSLKCFISTVAEDNQRVMLYLLPVAPVFCHHLPQRLQHFDAETLLVLLQQLFGVFDQPGDGKRDKWPRPPNDPAKTSMKLLCVVFIYFIKLALLMRHTSLTGRIKRLTSGLTWIWILHSHISCVLLCSRGRAALDDAEHPPARRAQLGPAASAGPPAPTRCPTHNSGLNREFFHTTQCLQGESSQNPMEAMKRLFYVTGWHVAPAHMMTCIHSLRHSDWMMKRHKRLVDSLKRSFLVWCQTRNVFH